MSRVVAVVACGVLLAACSMSMPSFDFLKSGPSTEILRIESEPPGADARTSQGQTCRTPCELNVPAASELAVTVALNGYQPQTLPVRVEGGGLQPNPLYVELQPAAPPARPKAPPPAKKRTSAAAPPAPKAQAQAAAPAPAAPAPAATYPTSSFGYPWPPASQ